MVAITSRRASFTKNYPRTACLSRESSCLNVLLNRYNSDVMIPRDYAFQLKIKFNITGISETRIFLISATKISRAAN